MSGPLLTALLYTDRYQDFDYGVSHPLKNLRLKLTFELISSLSLLSGQGITLVEPEPATEEELLAIHREDYLEALKAADGGHLPNGAYRYGLGSGDNPVFPGVYTFSALVAGASLQAARLIDQGKVDRAFNIAGGLHHAFPARAAGFCYLNDPALAIAHLVKEGKRIAYVDLDAHHGDGVQAIFYHTNQVLTISLHESGDYLFPGTGFVEEIGEGHGKGFSVNVPLFPGSDDEILLWAFQEVVPPLLKAFRPDVLVAQLGIDGHRTDPLTHLHYTLNGFAEAIRRLKALAPRMIALGGGGYDLFNVPRAWALAWGILNNQEGKLPEELPRDFQKLLKAHGIPSGERLFDPPFVLHGPEKVRAFQYVRDQVARLRALVFPLHGL